MWIILLQLYDEAQNVYSLRILIIDAVDFFVKFDHSAYSKY
jgi:hypothetical protein